MLLNFNYNKILFQSIKWNHSAWPQWSWLLNLKKRKEKWEMGASISFTNAKNMLLTMLRSISMTQMLEIRLQMILWIGSWTITKFTDIIQLDQEIVSRNGSLRTSQDMMSSNSLTKLASLRERLEIGMTHTTPSYQYSGRIGNRSLISAGTPTTHHPSTRLNWSNQLMECSSSEYHFKTHY